MFDVNKIRKDFKMLDKTMQGHKLVYFDNAATSLTPNCVIDAMNDYYFNYKSNSHSNDSDISLQVTKEIEKTRKIVADFINADVNEVVFTTGTTQSLNFVAFGYALKNINQDDEIILNVAEHASNLLPWYEVADKKSAKIVYAPLNQDGVVTLETIKKVVNKRTKLISIAYVGNVLGQQNEVEKIISFAHQNNIVVVVDAAQAVAHQKIDVKAMDCDFLAFSAHKMCGPTGIGVLYGKYDLLEQTDSLLLGGGMNVRFDNKPSMLLKHAPIKFEGGTQALAEIIGFAKAIEYINSIGLDNIQQYEKELKEYAIKKLSKLDNIIIYNQNSKSAIITFNIKGVFCQDAGTYFNYKGIAVRSGHHCAKLLPEFLKQVGTVRASLYFYNTFEEIDEFVEVCQHGGDFLDAFIN